MVIQFHIIIHILNSCAIFNFKKPTIEQELMYGEVAPQNILVLISIKIYFIFFNENIVADFLKTLHDVFEPNGINRY